MWIYRPVLIIVYPKYTRRLRRLEAIPRKYSVIEGHIKLSLKSDKLGLRSGCILDFLW